MFGSIGGFEILVLLGIGLLVFGPKRLPEMGRLLARGMVELRKVASEVKSAVEREADLGEVTRAAGDLKRAVNTEARRLFTDIEIETARLPGPAPAGSGPGGAVAPGTVREAGEPASEPREQNGR